VFDPTGVYGAPIMPPVDEKLLAGQDLEARTASGLATGVITIEGRAFGFAAIRCARLGPDVGITVIRSET
jgi:adenine/guanine phosphoribosyltransferase-like PRPP-binding protein